MKKKIFGTLFNVESPSLYTSDTKDHYRAEFSGRAWYFCAGETYRVAYPSRDAVLAEIASIQFHAEQIGVDIWK
jgi:hypothetical protein